MSTILYPVLVSMLAAIALFVGFTGLTIRPLRDISRTVSKVTDGDLSARVDNRYTQIGDTTGMLTMSSDLTEMARNVNSMIETLENQENDRAIFISSVAHDIRTPLTSINGFVTAMMDGTIPPELFEKYLTKIKSEVDKIRSLVVSMTEASSLSHVDPALMEEFDLKDAVADLLSELEPQLKTKKIEVEVRINEDGGTKVYGEVQMLCRVLLNIVTNAIKFTPEGGKIIISSRIYKNKVRIITVEDSGPGVEPDKRSRVFESFYKTDPSRKQEGFGLGLYICKQILVGHDQMIRLDESRELGGAMFIFSFPIPPVRG
jgi:signal transduction histidine kinase